MERQEEMYDRDLYCIPDAGKDGNRNALTVNFTGLKKDVRHLHVMYQQESMEARLAKVPATDVCTFMLMIMFMFMVACHIVF